jgi:hypothetical protein
MKLKLFYCCDALQQEIDDPRVFISYISKYREYAIGTIDSNIVRLIYNCPWCGTKLPKSLRKKWFSVLETEHNFDDPWNEKQSKLIPEEFKTDEWWKKRGL